MPNAVAIVLAGGSGSRMGGSANKVFVDLAGLPLLSHSLRMFNQSDVIDRIVVVARAVEMDDAAGAVQMALADKTVAIVEGGVDRQGSEWAGLCVIANDIRHGEIDVVAIHDGARPFVPAQLVIAVVATARDIGGAVPGLRYEEPLYTREHGGGFGLLGGSLVRVQTPQAFRAAPLLAAYERARRDRTFSAADTAETMERFGTTDVAVVPGAPANLKITFAADLERAESIARRARRSWG